ncbi:carbohydrate esterase family 1 protein [Athelia psychrophila]|uniref:feruloyl esterase n=1 Tax=Athelia psychrophila TaxID=1759441 RepID=A0A166F043_9AGAM|nr:carbohydrate esterase family 1 protein [Fibularhizoctonia sp. CBS 109695]
MLNFLATATILSGICSLTSGFAIHDRRTTSGCGSTPSWSFNNEGHYTRSLNGRSYLVHIPVAYNGSSAHPTVFSFHAFEQDPNNQELISGFSDPGLFINGTGIIAVYPEALLGPGKSEDGDVPQRAWQGAPYSKAGVDDVTFTMDIIQDLQEHLCVDKSRIYASGKSNGGGFTNLLACNSTSAPLFAAFAPVSAALYPKTHPIHNCTPGRVIPIINFHGLADDIIPFVGRDADHWTGETSYALPNITKYREAWAERNSCNNGSTTGSGKSNPDVGFTIDGLGHSWPSTAGLDGGTTSFNATTAEIIPFFDMHWLEHP